ncbi:hypothetical protein [Ponticaulis sp.]|uniref:tyrosine-protein kinase family protein n=1 Tax=Ponticaulis sp. TaxID=2020902 RepID=UPI000C6675FB|nr:hypothetical protein [Ponticaulis sp.]MAJ08551.1 hypothetical protein [Ponticaulis sp.]HBH90535.1 hypothetical protein [Hyphomonadaceae bacterium]HBJ94681.1 hypothetical protein [Hyphomonadaceae bacterium]|tara:strand:+ start:4623 stop:5327 length:705 start_codon:yes stop_codon:yes gene_type:complete
MIDLRSEITDLARAVDRIPGSDRGRSVMVIGADPGNGASSVAASLAVLLAGRATRAAWLIDLDLRGNGQFNAFQQRIFPRIGLPGRPLDASLNVDQFYQVVPQVRANGGASRGPLKLLGAHRVEHSNLFVTRFRTEHIKPGQRVQVRSGGAYWDALRKVSDWAVLDAPALDSSTAGLALCRYVDGVVIVMEADQTTAESLNATRDQIEAHGGRCVGVVVNQIRGDARFADRFSG